MQANKLNLRPLLEHTINSEQIKPDNSNSKQIKLDNKEEISNRINFLCSECGGRSPF